MAKIVEVTVNYGETFNMGNYESLRLDCGIRAQLREGENCGEVYKKALIKAKQMVLDAAQAEIGDPRR